MMNESKQPLVYGLVAAVLGAVLIAIAALWKNTVMNHAQTTEGAVAGSAADALLVGGLIVLGMLCVIVAVVLFLVAWWRSQRHDDEGPLISTETPVEPESNQTQQNTADTAFGPNHMQPPHPQ